LVCLSLVLPPDTSSQRIEIEGQMCGEDGGTFEAQLGIIGVTCADVETLPPLPPEVSEEMVRALCKFCASVPEADRLLDDFKPWDARVLSHLDKVRRHWESFREVETCSVEFQVQACGSFIDLLYVFDSWLQHFKNLAGSHHFNYLIQHVDPSQRREATWLYAWWTVRRAWLDPECRGEDRAPLERYCIAHKAFGAMWAIKQSYDWALATEFYDYLVSMKVMGLLEWPHVHKTFDIYVPMPEIRASPPLWQPTDDPVLSRLTQVLEAHAYGILDEWRSFRNLPWIHGEEHLDYPEYLLNTSSLSWYRWRFYTTASGWNMSLCEPMPRLCNLMQRELPGLQLGVFDGYEEVAISLLPPGAHVVVHSGEPTRLNLHMGLTGLSPGSYLAVVKQDSEVAYLEWQSGKVSAIFDDSYDHFVQVDAEATEPRAVLHVGICHPKLLPSL